MYNGENMISERSQTEVQAAGMLDFIWLHLVVNENNKQTNKQKTHKPTSHL